MKILVGSTNPAKIEAIKEAVEKCIYFKDEKIEIIGEKIDSGIGDMPLSLEENMIGAKNRAENLLKAGFEADFYIGMEGGNHQVLGTTFLFGVVYILNKSGEGHFGISNMMPVPDYFIKKIYEEGKELGPILSEVTGIENASKKNGAFGAWSDDMLTRKDQFVLAFLSGIVPFYNKYYKLK